MYREYWEEFLQTPLPFLKLEGRSSNGLKIAANRRAIMLGQSFSYVLSYIIWISAKSTEFFQEFNSKDREIKIDTHPIVVGWIKVI